MILFKKLQITVGFQYLCSNLLYLCHPLKTMETKGPWKYPLFFKRKINTTLFNHRSPTFPLSFQSTSFILEITVQRMLIYIKNLVLTNTLIGHPKHFQVICSLTNGRVAMSKTNYRISSIQSTDVF